MLLKELEHELTKNHYKKVSTTVEFICPYYYMKEDVLYVVTLINDCTGLLKLPGEFDQIMVGVRQLFHLEPLQQIKSIGVIITEDINRTKQMTRGFEDHWLLDSNTKRLIIYEDQPDEFLNLQDCIDNCFNTSIIKKLHFHSHEKTPVKYFSLVNTIIILMNCLVYILLEWNGSTTDVTYMYRHGALSVYNFLKNGEYLSLVSSAFMHFGLQHLIGNMVVLWYIGDNLERRLGRFKYLVVYLICAVGSNLISVIWYAYCGKVNVVTAGASGAIFGIVGALLYVVIRHRGKLEDITSRQLILLVIFTVYTGVTNPTVNNAAHIGGLVIGIISGWIFYTKKMRLKKQS